MFLFGNRFLVRRVLPVGHGRGWVALALGLALFAASARGQSLEQYRLQGFQIGGEFTLTNQLGKKTSLSDFRGKPVLLSFGYTHCPDVCPATMVVFAGVLKALGDQAKAMRAVFVTVDPERDTAPRLKAYLGHFDPGLVGLTGSPTEIAQAAEKFAVRYQKENKDGAGGYTMGHTSFIYLLDGKGAVRYLFPFDVARKTLLAGVRSLLP